MYHKSQGKCPFPAPSALIFQHLKGEQGVDIDIYQEPDSGVVKKLYKSDWIGILPVKLTRDICAKILNYGDIMFLALQALMKMRDLWESVLPE